MEQVQIHKEMRKGGGDCSVFTNGALLKGAYICTDNVEPNYCKGDCEWVKTSPTRPPQSWMYIEELKL